MANMKTDGSGVITTEFYTGRCPVHCELCFANFGMNGSSIPFSIYHRVAKKVYDYATCTKTRERLRQDSKKGALDWVEPALCGPRQYAGDNNNPRLWEPAEGFDLETGKMAPFFKGMTAEDYLRLLKPLEDDPNLYNIPKVPEAPWMKKIPAVQTYNGQWLPATLRANTMSDSSTAPSEWIIKLREIWGDDCFFNSNIHAIKRFPFNLESGLYHKVVVTANPGLQQMHAGLERYRLWYPKKADVVNDPELLKVAREVYARGEYGGDLPGFLAQQDWGTINGLITLRLGAGTMKGGARNRPWHFFNPYRLQDLRSGYDQYEENIKFYRVRALPTIQPRVDQFSDVPVVYTVLRFKTMSQACEFANKYDLEINCVVHSRKDEVICQYYGVPYTVAKEGEPSVVMMRDSSSLNGSPNKGEWSYLYYQGNFFRAGKEQMDAMQFVCDRASKSCKACGLCATLDGTEENWANPTLARLGIYPKEYSEQDHYLADSEKNKLPTPGVVGKVGRMRYDLSPVPSGIGIVKEKFVEEDEGDDEELERNPDEIVTTDSEYPKDVGDPVEELMAMAEESFGQRRRNPSSGMALDVMQAMLKAAVDYGTQESGFWWQGWNTHEEVAEMVAYVFWQIMVTAHQEGVSQEEAVEMASAFSSKACGMDLFEDDLDELSLMYSNESYWNDQFGPTH